MKRYEMSAVAISTVNAKGKYVEYEELEKMIIASDHALEALYYVVHCQEMMSTQSDAMQKEFRVTFENLNSAMFEIKRGNK